MALVLQADLAEVGIELELIKMETAALKGILNDAALDYDLCLYQFTDNLGTDFTLRNQYGSYEEDGVLKKNGSNRANMKDAKFNEMIDAALIEQDSAKREKMYNEIEEYLNEIVPIVPIATSYVNIGIKKGHHPASSGTAPRSTTTATSACPLRNPFFMFKFQSE